MENDFIAMQVCKYDDDRNDQTWKSVVLQITTMDDNMDRHSGGSSLRYKY
jgi:hypothetical protein